MRRSRVGLERSINRSRLRVTIRRTAPRRLSVNYQPLLGRTFNYSFDIVRRHSSRGFFFIEMVCLYRLIYNEWLIFALFCGLAFLFLYSFFLVAPSFCFLSSIKFSRDIFEGIRGYWWKILDGWLLKKVRDVERNILSSKFLIV